MLKHLLVITFALNLLNLSGNNTVTINQKGDYIDLNGRIEVYEDISTNLTITEAITQDYIAYKGVQINFRFSKSAFWIKFTLQNNCDEKVFFDLGNHFIEHADIYYSRNNESFEHISIGALGDESVISKKHLSFHELSLTKGQPYHFYVRLQSTTPLRAPIYIRTLTNHVLTQQRDGNIKWFFYGASGFLLLFTLFVLLSLRKKIYAYFALSLFFLTLYQFGFDNLYPAISLFGESDFLVKKMNGTIIWSLFFHLKFASEFIGSKSNTKWVSFILNTLMYSTAFIGISFLINFRFGNALAYSLSPFIWISFTILVTAIYLKGVHFIRFFVVGTYILLAAVLLHIFSNLGFLGTGNLLPQFAIKYGYLGQIIFFVIALMDRYFLYQNNLTSILEAKVEERTTELENTLNSLTTRQQQLIQSEKLASIGVLSAGVAHEINTPLNAINCGISVFESYSNDSEIDEIEKKEQINLSLQMMKEGIEKTSDIVQSLMSFSHIDKSPLTDSNINHVIDNTLLLLRARIPDTITIIKDYPKDIITAIYKDKFHQIIYNIIMNAVEAISVNKATITITTSVTKQNHTKYSKIDIENSGSHISASTLPRIFEPFFTTKDPGKGIGLGLSIAYSYSKDHNGYITATNTYNGVKFSVFIPNHL